MVMNGSTPADVNTLPPETLDFAERMFEAARLGNLELLSAALSAGLPVNLTNAKGNTLLMLAAYAGQTDVVRDLLNRGADPNRKNDLGQSIVAGAVFKGHNDIVKALMEHGANPRDGTPNAIQAAFMFKRTELDEVLGTKPEDIDLSNVPSPLSSLPS